MSGGLACAGCHPDGREDGHVWLETRDGGLLAAPLADRFDFSDDHRIEMPTASGFPRQTPMLAGRVDADGPYGWRGQQETLAERIRHGFAMHRWRGKAWRARTSAHARRHTEQAEAIAAFLRTMPAPAVERRALTDDEARGRRLFEFEDTGCSTYHAAEDGFSNR